jgi:metal-responsive CopG/Arc/MetJ family transcriptional regulator
MKVKAHLVLPKEILEEVDQIAGKRGRSLFIAEAALEKLEPQGFRSQPGSGFPSR